MKNLQKGVKAKVDQLLTELYNWCAINGIEGAVTVGVDRTDERTRNIYQITRMLQADPDKCFTRGDHTFYLRPLTKDEIEQIRIVKWGKEVKTLVDKLISRRQSPMTSHEIDITINPRLADSPGGGSETDKRSSLIACINITFAENKLPFVVTFPECGDTSAGPFRLYKVKQ